ncbi:hypothetical protein [Phocoenobacter skyensis]|uniref:Uncharacterized protein n=2 Tax=Phocoenobacter skyensis TaxID=97481 RepID=A0A1H7YR68_9PAST|nr:hypothetical protein [Pasteurella skyensis]MDP8185532.1 hypothetical protein [Pasteurella skyensis]SEM48463.1 hypothetical protein SAMN05444853_12010 [Pasteurella skyensis]
MMTKTLEEILGFDPLTYVNEIPGKIKCDFREFWYVEDNEGKFQKKLFDKLTDAVDPPLCKSGGVITQNCKITTINGRVFEGLSYKGDLEGWRQQIIQGAEILNVDLAQIQDNKLVLLTDESYDLDECDISFY